MKCVLHIGKADSLSFMVEEVSPEELDEALSLVLGFRERLREFNLKSMNFKESNDQLMQRKRSRYKK